MGRPVGTCGRAMGRTMWIPIQRSELPPRQGSSRGAAGRGKSSGLRPERGFRRHRRRGWACGGGFESLRQLQAAGDGGAARVHPHNRRAQ